MKQLSGRARAAGIVILILACLWLTQAQGTPGAIAQTSQTRQVGVIAITADQFSDLGGGLTMASGNIRFGQSLFLIGATARVLFDANNIQADGLLAMAQGPAQLPILIGPFSASGVNGLVAPESGAVWVMRVAGFALAGTSAIEASLDTGLVAGTGDLLIEPPGVSATAPAFFTIRPGALITSTPTITGYVSLLHVGASGVTLDAAGVQLLDEGLRAPTAQLTMPPELGGLRVNIQNLSITPNSLGWGDGLEFAMPDAIFGQGDHLTITRNRGWLFYEGNDDEYRIVITGTMALTLPENSPQSIAVNVTLQEENGQPYLSGSFDHLTLTLAQTTLDMENIQIGTDGLSVDTALLTLPPQLHGSNAAVYNVHVAPNGHVSIGSASAVFMLPDIPVGEGRELVFRNGVASLVYMDSEYRIEADGALSVTLPENSQTISVSVTLARGELTGRVNHIGVSVAGASLAMTNATFVVGRGVTDGVSVDAAALVMPPELGNASVAISDARIDDTGLHFANIDVGFDAPDLAFGQSFKLVRNHATLDILSDFSGYRLTANSTLSITLPENAQSLPFSFSMAGDLRRGYTLSGVHIDRLALAAAGTTIDLSNLALNKDGFLVQTAVMTLPASLGGRVQMLDDVAITRDGLQIGQGEFDLPDLTFAGGRVDILNPNATLVIADGLYHISARGALSITLPENQIASNVQFGIASGGQLTGALSDLRLNLAGMTLTMQQIALSNNGLDADNALLQAPQALGGVTAQLDEARITQSGLDFGAAGLTVSLPPFQFGSSFDLTRSVASLNIISTTLGAKYQLAIAATLDVNLPDNDQQQSITLTMVYTPDSGYDFDGALTGLLIDVGGVALMIGPLDLRPDGLYADSATLVIPTELGGLTTTVRSVSITRADKLKFADVTLLLPDMTFGAAGQTARGDLAGPSRSNGLASAAPFKLSLTSPLPGTTQASAPSPSSPALLPQGEGRRFPRPAGEGLGERVSPERDTMPTENRPLKGGKAAASAPTLALRQNRATLAEQNNHYIWSIHSQIVVALPENNQTATLDVTMQKSNGRYLLSGTLSQLALTIAGGTLTINNMTLNNDGLSVDHAVYALPPKLGGSATVDNVRITSAGLTIGNMALADIVFGGNGRQLRITSISASLTAQSGVFAINGQGTLVINLPNFAMTTSLTFAIAQGQISAGLPSLNMTVAGLTLALSKISFDNDGIHAGAATLTLPAKLGGESVSLTNVDITKDNLSFNGSITMPRIKIGDGSTLNITNPAATLAVVGSDYVFGVNGTLNIILPPNTQSVSVAFQIDKNGDINGSVDQVHVTVAGTTLTMKQALFSNAGLKVATALLQFPDSLGGETFTVNDVAITGQGLDFGAASFTMRDIKPNGDDSVFEILHPTATLAHDAAGYRFAIAGQLVLNLPQNSGVSADVQAVIGPDGELRGNVPQLILKVANVQLELDNATLTAQSISVLSATLRLPAQLGGGSGAIYDVQIDHQHGLTFGGGSANVPVPDFKIGGSAGLSVSNARMSASIAADRTYNVAFAATVGVEVRGSAGVQATGIITADSVNNLTGQLTAFEVDVVGLKLGVQSARIVNDALTIAQAKLAAPREWGGEAADVYNVSIGLAAPHEIKIGGGDFALPTIHAGGFTLQLNGGFVPVEGGYNIVAGGAFGVPGLGSSSSCAIGVNATLFLSGTATQIQITPQDEKAVISDQWSVIDDGTASAVAASRLHLRNVGVGMYGCAIPVGATGMALSRVAGSLSLDSGTTTVKLGVTVESMALRLPVIGSALRGDVDTTITINPLDLAVAGSMYVFVFKAGQVDVDISERNGFLGAMWIEAVVARGQFSLHAWSATGNFHLTGSGSVEAGIPKGKIWHWGGVNVPPSDWVLGNIGVQFGEFNIDSKTVYGFKGTVSVMGYKAGIFVDDNGDLKIGNVDNYKQVNLMMAQEAWQRREALLESGQLAASQAWTDGDLTLLANGDVYVSVPITVSTDVIFALARRGSAPTLTLLTPAGVEITPDSLPSGVAYSETIEITSAQFITQQTYVVSMAQAGTWQARLNGQSLPQGDYALSVLGSNPPPTLSEVSIAPTGDTTALARWRLNSGEADTRVDVYVTRGPISHTVVITLANGATTTQDMPFYSGALLERGIASPVNGDLVTHSLDLSQLPSGAYWVWLEAEDYRNTPARVYASSQVVITQSAPSGAWDADIETTPDYRQLVVQWDRYPHPDLEGYTLYVGETPGATQATPVSAARVITVGQVNTATVSALRPGQTYYLAVKALGRDNRWQVLSSEGSAKTQTAEFDLAGPGEMSVLGGSSASAVITLTTPLTLYPEGVGLSLGCVMAGPSFKVYLPLVMKGGAADSVHMLAQAAETVDCASLDGIDVTFLPPVATPTISGTQAQVAISVTQGAPGGVYHVPVRAFGGGATREVELPIRVLEPRYSLAVAPNVITLTQDQSVPVSVTASSLNGESDAVLLRVKGAPAGARWSFDRDVISTGNGGSIVLIGTFVPGESASLILTDTEALDHGTYTLSVSGDDGHHVESAALTLIVVKPTFDVEASTPSPVVAGDAAAYQINVLAEDGWTRPVTLTLDPASVPPHVVYGFLLGQAPPSAGGTVLPGQTSVVVNPPSKVYLVVVTSRDSPVGLYFLRARAEGGGDILAETLDLQIVSAPPSVTSVYLPIVLR